MLDEVGLQAEQTALEIRLSEPSLHSDARQARRVARRHGEVTALLSTYRLWKGLLADAGAARELADEAPEFAAEAVELIAKAAVAYARLEELLTPPDPLDERDVILQIKAGEGGEESALFAGDLLRMYLRYAERHGWTTELLAAEDSDLGGYRDVSLAIKESHSAGVGTDWPVGPYAALRFEGGVHRVQRVPVTESAGRIHTSAVGVLVLPEIDETEVEVNADDLRIDVYRSSGKGGQSVNTTDSAVRITHLPTGIVATCQNERSQLQNRDQAMRILRARLAVVAADAAAEQASAVRKAQVRTVDRSERIRTYNFPESRITDHRSGYKAHNLLAMLDGDLDPIVRSCVMADATGRLTVRDGSDVGGTSDRGAALVGGSAAAGDSHG